MNVYGTLENLFYLLYESDSMYQNAVDFAEEDTAFASSLENMGITGQQAEELSMLKGDAILAHEMQGFVNGFRLAMNICGEAGNQTASKNKGKNNVPEMQGTDPLPV